MQKSFDCGGFSATERMLCTFSLADVLNAAALELISYEAEGSEGVDKDTLSSRPTVPDYAGGGL